LAHKYWYNTGFYKINNFQPTQILGFFELTESGE